MDAQNKPEENMIAAANPPAIRQPTDSTACPQSLRDSDAGGRAGPAASDRGATRVGLILLVLCAVGAGLLIGILALQVTEYRFYKAPPGVWPQPGAGGMVSAPAAPSAPAALAAPLSPVAPTTPSAMPVPVAASTSAPVATKP